MKFVILKSFLIYFAIFISFSAYSFSLTPYDFAKRANYNNVIISPDGKHLATSIFLGTDKAIMIFETVGLKVKGKFSFSSDTSPGEMRWINNERIAFKLLEIKAWSNHPGYYGQLLAINLDGSKAETLYGYKNQEASLRRWVAKKKTAIVGWAEFVDILPNDPNNIIIQSTPQTKDNSTHPSILKIDVYKGSVTQRLGVSPVERGGFLSDGRGHIKLTYGFDSNNNMKIYKRKDNDDSWKEVQSDFVTSDFIPLSYTETEDEVLIADYGKTGYWNIFKLNMTTGTYSAPLVRIGEIDISSISLNHNSHKIESITIDNGYSSYIVLDLKSKEGLLKQKILNIFKNRNVVITSRTLNNEQIIIESSTDVSPSQYFLYNSITEKIKLLFSSLSHLPKKDLSPVIPIKYQARDGISISGYLTLPKNKNKTHPAVVLIHGGPHGVRDYWQFDPEVQFLASQGYAVLQINYRGSKGYGANFSNAGKKNWGTLIQQDIIDGSRWLAVQPDIESSRICIMGSSFGAFSAISSAIQAPKLFKCIIANAGIYDLTLLNETGDIKNTLSGKYYLRDVLPEDINELRKQSPIHYVSKLEAPVLIMHGNKDERAPIEHAEILREKLEEQNKFYQWKIFKKEEHGVYSEKGRTEYYETIKHFLSEHNR